MLARTAGAEVLAVQSDLRNLPICDGAMSAATCIETHSQFREGDRARIVAGLGRVLAQDGLLSILAFNYNAVFRLWSRLGNEGARQGEHMLGGDYFYLRFKRSELRRELEAAFEVVELTGIRNIPARSIAGAFGTVRLGSMGDRSCGTWSSGITRPTIGSSARRWLISWGFFW